MEHCVFNQCTSTGPARVYGPPVLTKLGNVSALTAAGSSGNTEANNGGQCQGPGLGVDSRRVCN